MQSSSFRIAASQRPLPFALHDMDGTSACVRRKRRTTSRRPRLLEGSMFTCIFTIRSRTPGALNGQVVRDAAARVGIRILIDVTVDDNGVQFTGSVDGHTVVQRFVEELSLFADIRSFRAVRVTIN